MQPSPLSHRIPTQSEYTHQIRRVLLWGSRFYVNTLSKLLISLEPNLCSVLQFIPLRPALLSVFALQFQTSPLEIKTNHYYSKMTDFSIKAEDIRLSKCIHKNNCDRLWVQLELQARKTKIEITIFAAGSFLMIEDKYYGYVMTILMCSRWIGYSLCFLGDH